MVVRLDVAGKPRNVMLLVFIPCRVDDGAGQDRCLGSHRDRRSPPGSGRTLLKVSCNPPCTARCNKRSNKDHAVSRSALTPSGGGAKGSAGGSSGLVAKGQGVATPGTIDQIARYLQSSQDLPYPGDIVTDFLREQ